MNKTYSKNKKAYHDFTMLETFEAGISLTGPEVKSVRASTINLKGSYVSIQDDKIALKGFHISRPSHLGNKSHDETRDKFLLLTKKEIKKIRKAVKETGVTLIVTEIYQREGTKKIKVKLNIAKGNKSYDKRAILKEKQLDRDTKRQTKDY